MTIRDNTLAGFTFSNEPRERAEQLVERMAAVGLELLQRKLLRQETISAQHALAGGEPLTVEQLESQNQLREECERLVWRIRGMRGVLSADCKRHREFLFIPGVVEALGVSESN